MKRLIPLLSLVPVLAVASGYKIPEQSLNSFALSAAYVANANGADATYFNPANMVFNDSERAFELSVTNFSLPKSNYEGTVTAGGTTYPASLAAGESESENTNVPNLHYSAKLNDTMAYGISVVVPGGMTKRWESTFQKMFAEEFGMRNIEINPTFAYKLSPDLSVGAGVRAIQSQGIVKSSGTISRELKGSTTEYGYNLALTFKPAENLSVGATYRSEIMLKEKGTAKLYYNTTKVYDGDASVEIPMPATLALGVAYRLDDTVIELTYDQTYWSAYKELDFEYGDGINSGVPAIDAALTASFDNPVAKEWKDTPAYRIGITHEASEALTLMLGYAKDKNPIPEKTVQFELPDADATIYSAGLRYSVGSHQVGFSFLQSIKEERKVTNATINGTFDEYKSTLLTLAYGYTF